MDVSQNYKKIFDTAVSLAKDTGGIVYSEHILYGILSTVGCVAERIVSRFISADRFLNTFKLRPRVVSVEFSERAARIADNAMKAAVVQGAPISSEHILYAVLLEKNSIAFGYLMSSGLDTEALRYDLERSFSLIEAPQKKAQADLSFDDLLKKLSDSKQGEPTQKSSAVSENGLSQVDSFKEKEPVFISKPASQTLSERSMEKLGKFGIDLTKKARDGALDPVIGRGKEIERIIQVLCRRTKNNPVLIGEPGVGKSAVIEGLAEAIVAKKVPELLLGKRVFSLDMSSIVAGTKYRGEFEEKFKTALDEIKRAGDIILFIDEIHTIMKAGASEGSLDAANILKPMLARGELQTVGATTVDEYRKYIEKDPALERRFQPVYVEQPSVSETIEILRGLKPKYEDHHKVTITDEALHAAAVLSDRYITDRYLPDKAIDLVDEAASRKKLFTFTVPDEIRKLDGKISEIEIEMTEAGRREQFTLAESLKTERDRLVIERNLKDAEWQKKRACADLNVTEDEIAEVVASWTGVPVKKLTESEAQKILSLADHLKKRVIGQDRAVEAIATAIKRARAGLKDITRPIGSFVFLGPTGVGKTELAKALAAEMFGDENLMIRMDMSEYMQKENVSKMIGSAPGYVGYEEGGQLTEKVRRKPYSVVLFDEIEKAHPEVYNLLLQILDDGRLTDSQGRLVSFKNTVIIMTSNAGAKDTFSKVRFGFDENRDASQYEKSKEKQIEALKQFMKPEFINRIDDIIVFEHLALQSVEKIGQLMIDKLVNKAAKQGLKLEISEEAKEFVFKKGYDPEYGARPLRRAISRYLEDTLSEEILSGRFKSSDTVEVVLEDGKIVFKQKEQ